MPAQPPTRLGRTPARADQARYRCNVVAFSIPQSVRNGTPPSPWMVHGRTVGERGRAGWHGTGLPANTVWCVDTQYGEEECHARLVPLYQEVEAQIKRITATVRLRVTAVRRLALLVTSVIAAQSGVINQVAAELAALGLTQASTAEGIARRLRRTLSDARLAPQTCYAPVLGEVIDWAVARRGGRSIVLAIDESSKEGEESSKEGEVHLLRVSLPYRGSSLPLAWAVWQQKQLLPTGQYWAHVAAVLAQVAKLLPPGLEVVVVADRAYDIPAFVDRVAAYGWHWVVRCKANGAGRFRDRAGREHGLRDLLRRGLPAPGRRWKARGAAFKEAGWQAVSVVGVWSRGHKEPLVVLSDLPARRFWIEPGFRDDKKQGWQWEDSQVQGLAHQERLLLALAWASLVVLCLGAQVAEARLAARRARPRRRPEHARASLFTLGLQRARQWLYRPHTVALRWHLPALLAESWTDQWQRAQGFFAHFSTVRP